MKKILFAMLAVLFWASNAHAQTVSGMELGYCDGEVSTKGTIASSQKDIMVSGAIRILPGEIKTYAGCRIDSIKAGLASKLNVDELTVWVRSSLTGNNLAEGTITTSTETKLAKGWNKVALNEPFVIPDNLSDGLYIGYTFHQKGASFGLSVLDKPTPNGLFVKIGDEDWADRSGEGVLCVEALVFGDNLPKLNLALNSISVQPVFAVSKKTLDIEATVKNVASQTITGFDFACKIDGLDEEYTAHVDETLPYKGEKTVKFTISPDIKSDEINKRGITVSIARLNEGVDEDLSNNTLSAEFEVVGQDFTRNVLVEEFTTEKCSNCPGLASKLKAVLAKEKYSDRVNAICRHSGYYTDWLTASCDDDYLWLYNQGGFTSAPAMMFDRFNFGESTAVVLPLTQASLEAYLDNRLAQTAFVSVNISAEADASDSKKINVRVSGSRAKEGFTSLPPRISVVALENDIPARNQAGAGKDYMQEHVNRAFNSVWGDEIVWNGDDYEYEWSFNLNNDWKVGNMYIVAYVSNYDPEDATNCEVANSARLESKDWKNVTTGISTTLVGHESPKEYYTLYGEKVSGGNIPAGVYIVKQGGKAKKVLIR